MRISQRSIETVRDTVDIAEVAAEFTALRRQGARYTGLCPYPDHSEKTPSFSVSPDKGFYYCFGCGKGGDAIKLVTDLKSLSFVEAVTYLAEKSGIELEFEGASDAAAKAAKERNQRRRSIHKALAAATAYYHKYLLESETPEAHKARAYLKERGMTRSTIEEFRLGMAPPRGSTGFVRAARRLGLERPVLEAAGLLSARGGERFSGRITFPISDRRGRIVGFGARAMGDDQPKYLNSPETEVFNKRDLLYGFPQVMEAMRRERAALIVEGYTDVLMLYQSGIKNAVATLGTATTPSHLRTLSSYADQVYVLFDPDTAGEKAIERAATTAAELQQDLRVLRLDEDPADWLLHHPPEEFQKMISGAVPALQYVFRRKAKRAQGADAAERARVVTEVKSLIQRIEDPVFYSEAIALASESLRINESTLRVPRQVEQNPSAYRSSATHPDTDPLTQASRKVLSLILAYPSLTKELLIEGVRTPLMREPVKLESADFDCGSLAEIFAIVTDYAGEDLSTILSDERSRHYSDQIAELASEGAKTVIATDKKRRGERILPSRVDAVQAWLGLKIVSCNRAKQRTDDYDKKERLYAEIQTLKQALRAIESGA